MTDRILAGDPPWLVAAFHNVGLRERAGPLSNPIIIEMYRAAGHKAPETLDDSTWSWCSAAECYWFQAANLPGTRSLMGRSWLKRKNSTRLDINKPLPRGAVVVLKYDDDPNHGHVANLLADNGATILVIGANQRNHVCTMTWKRSSLIGAIWPNEWPMSSANVPLPRPRPEIPEDAPEGDPQMPAEPPRPQPDDPGTQYEPAPEPAEAKPPFWRRWLPHSSGYGGSFGGGWFAGQADGLTIRNAGIAIGAAVALSFIGALFLFGKQRVAAFLSRQIRRVFE